MISITRSVAVCTIDSDISRIPNREREGITLGSCSLGNRLDHPSEEGQPFKNQRHQGVGAHFSQVTLYHISWALKRLSAPTKRWKVVPTEAETTSPCGAE